MKVTKQSLIDWEVTNEGAHVAWITKVSGGYEVIFKGDVNKYFQTSFAQARVFATTY